MPNSNQKLTSMVAAFADVLDGYNKNSLRQIGVQGRLLEYFESKDPNKVLTTRLLNNFKKKLKIRAKLKSLQGKKIHRIEWGDFIKSNDILNEALKPTAIWQVAKDDVGEVIIPRYPNGTNFEILYTGLYCIKRQRDRLWAPSNETYVITSAISTTNGNNIQRDEIHPIDTANKHYNDVDSGETRVGPVATCWFGEENEVSLVVTLMENDEGDPDAYKDEISIIVGAAATIASFAGVPLAAALAPLAVELINWLAGSEDDLIGVDTFVINPDDLKLYAKSTGYENIPGTNESRIKYNFNTYHNHSGVYKAFFRIDADRQPLDDIIIPPEILETINARVIREEFIQF